MRTADRRRAIPRLSATPTGDASAGPVSFGGARSADTTSSCRTPRRVPACTKPVQRSASNAPRHRVVRRPAIRMVKRELSTSHNSATRAVGRYSINPGTYASLTQPVLGRPAIVQSVVAAGAAGIGHWHGYCNPQAAGGLNCARRVCPRECPACRPTRTATSCAFFVHPAPRGQFNPRDRRGARRRVRVLRPGIAY